MSKKRVELHLHTKMSEKDGLVDIEELIDYVTSEGYNAVAVTDHNSVQTFPKIYKKVSSYNKDKTNDEKIKVLYGTELTMIDDERNIVIRGDNKDLLNTTYVVMDTEQTGFSPNEGASLIQINALKINNGEIIDRFNELIDPKIKLPAKITQITNITDDMLKGKDDEETVIKRFKQWYGDLPIVAHNASFDVSFIETAYDKYNLGTFTNTVINTLYLSFALNEDSARHSISALIDLYEINTDTISEDGALILALIFQKMIDKLTSKGIKKICDLNKINPNKDIHKYGTAYHINLIALNQEGLKNLYKLVSLAHTKYLYITPRILKSEIQKNRNGLLVGSGCYQSEIFRKINTITKTKLTELLDFYDYVEIQPIEVYDHLIQMNEFKNKEELINHIKEIIRIAKESNKLVVATGDVHHLSKKDKFEDKDIIKSIPNQYFRSTQQMLKDFDFLDKDLAYEIVVTNTNKIADRVEDITITDDKLYLPKKSS